MKRQCKRFDSFPVQRDRWGMLSACGDCLDRKICLGEAPEPDEPPKKKPGRKPGTVLTVQQRKNLSDGMKKAAVKRKATPLTPTEEPEAETAVPAPTPVPTAMTEQELIPAVEPAQVAKRVERAKHAREAGKRMQEARAENRYEVDFNADPELLARLFQIANYERRTPQDQLKIMIRDFPLPEARI